jgi:hypothetical protein
MGRGLEVVWNSGKDEPVGVGNTQVHGNNVRNLSA